MKILFNENKIPEELSTNLSLLSFCELRDGIFNLLERSLIKYPNAELYYHSSSNERISYFISKYNFCKPYNGEKVDTILIPGEDYYPWNIISNLAAKITKDICLLNMDEYINNKAKKVDVMGNSNDLFIHKSATVHASTIFNVTNGPIVISRNSIVEPFTYIEGPAFIGSKTTVANARIKEGCILGHNCTVSGEIYKSYMGDYSNKAHTGSLNYSYIGNWVNIGGMASTANLKFDYSEIYVSIKNKLYSTNQIKFGAIIGDYSKIGACVLIHPGTVIDIGSYLIKNPLSGYYPPFSLMNRGRKNSLKPFMKTIEKTKERRSEILSEEEQLLIKMKFNDDIERTTI